MDAVTDASGIRARADRLVYRASLWVSGHWLEATLLLVLVGVAGSLVAGAVFGEGWDGVALFQGCYGGLLAIGIFTWTLAGVSTREADGRRKAAEEFAVLVGSGSYGAGQLWQWHREVLADVLDVQAHSVESELMVWFVEQSSSKGPREALVITNGQWFLRLVGRGRGGLQVRDLATGERLN